jgi:two-component system, NarL family, response regulator LiaR
MPKNPIRVAVVDDHAMIRAGWCTLLRACTLLKAFDDLQLVGAASNGREAVRLCAEAHPDVVLMDLVMPVMDGIAATREIRQIMPNIRVVATTSLFNESLVPKALASGAVGHVSKSAPFAEIANAIRAASVLALPG